MPSCPCPFFSSGADAPKKLVEMSPFRDAGSGSDEEQQAPAATGWRGWLEKAAAPLQAYREHSAKAAVKAERVNVLKSGATMRLLWRSTRAPIRSFHWQHSLYGVARSIAVVSK